MTKSDFYTNFLLEANFAGQELFNNFYPNFINNIILEHFPITTEQFENFEDDDYFIDFVDDCITDIKNTHSNAIKYSKPIWEGRREIVFIIIKFNAKKFIHLRKSGFLSECCDNFLITLRENFLDRNINFYYFDFCHNILRKSTNSLFEYISNFLIGTKNSNLFSIIEDLAKLTYEKNNNQGLIYFYRPEQIEELDFQFRFVDTKEFSRNNIKLIRKILELTNKNEKIGIISDTESIYGIAKEKKDALHYVLSFSSNNSWELFYCNEKLLEYKNNKAITNNSELAIEDFKNSFTKVFHDKQPTDNILNSIKQLIKINKGTILIIANNADTLIEDYIDLCIRIEPEYITEENIKKLSSIDGAILIDETGLCYGFGIILDGFDTQNGDPARGSRYNSSERFFDYRNSIKQSEDKLLVFVLSDDGNYNLFPEIIDYKTLIKQYLATHNNVSFIELQKNLKFKSLLHARFIISDLVRKGEITRESNELGTTIFNIKN